MWWQVCSTQMNRVFVFCGHTCRKSWMSESLHLLWRLGILSGNEFIPDLKSLPGVISTEEHKQCMVSYHLPCINAYITQQLKHPLFFKQLILSRLPGRFSSKLLLQLEFKSKLVHFYSIEVSWRINKKKYIKSFNHFHKIQKCCSFKPASTFPNPFQ